MAQPGHPALGNGLGDLASSYADACLATTCASAIAWLRLGYPLRTTTVIRQLPITDHPCHTIWVIPIGKPVREFCY
jgi:hypothetical protein